MNYLEIIIAFFVIAPAVFYAAVFILKPFLGKKTGNKCSGCPFIQSCLKK